jgi:hypothetical protein
MEYSNKAVVINWSYLNSPVQNCLTNTHQSTLSGVFKQCNSILNSRFLNIECNASISRTNTISTTHKISPACCSQNMGTIDEILL